MPCSPKNDPLFACLVLERGAPYEKGACFPAAKQPTLGRSTSSCTPGYHAFDSLLISRKHCWYRTARRGLVDMRAEKQTRHAAERRTAAPVLSVLLKHGDKNRVWRQTLCRCGFPSTPNWTRRSIITAPTLYRALPCRNRPSPWSSTPRKSPCWWRRGSYAVGEGMVFARTGV